MTKSERIDIIQRYQRAVTMARQVTQLRGGDRGAPFALASEGRGVDPLQTPRHPPNAVDLVESMPASAIFRVWGAFLRPVRILIALRADGEIAKTHHRLPGSGWGVLV